MKICILSPIYPISSDQRLGIFVHEQAKYLARENNEVYVITLGSPDDKDFEAKENINVYRIKPKKSWTFLPLRGLFFAMAMLKKLIELNKKYGFDIIHSHFVGPTTALIGMASKRLKKPLIITAHGIGLLTGNPLKKILIRLYLGFSLKVICVSNYVAWLAAKYTEKKKIVVINNGIDPEKLNPTKSASAFKRELGLKDEKILLSVGGLVERKGYGIILNSLPGIIKSCPNIKYFIIGKGPEKENLQNLVNMHGLQKHVVFIDYANAGDLANFYNICDLFVLMSRTIKEKEGIEGFGIAYIEASYFGKPVIGGKSGGTADSIINNVTGYRIEPTNEKDFIGKVAKLLKNGKLRRKMGRQGRNLVKTRLLWEHNAKNLVKVYRSLIASQETKQR